MICLQNICVDFIAEEFERFYSAFTMSSNDNFKRDFDFLQRKYSYELGSQLLSKEKLKGEYLQFLLNEHLSTLDEQWLKNSHYQNSMKDVYCRLPNLTKISCSISTDEMLENIAKFCPKIVEIDAEISYVTDEGVKYLCKSDDGNIPCPRLKKLSIPSPRLTNKGLELIIRNLKSLEKLDHDTVPLVLYYMHGEDLLKLEKASTYNLVELKFFFGCHVLPYYIDILKICRAVCPKLKSLTFCISKKEQLDLFNNTFLEYLAVAFSMENFNIDSFLKVCGCQLVFLSVSNCIMSISELAVSCPKLKQLILDNVTFTYNRSGSKAVFPCLLTCTFNNIEFSRTSYKVMDLLFLSSPNIGNVNFIRCDLSTDTKTCILKCCEKRLLEAIVFKGCLNFEKKFAKDVLLCCPSLIYMEISFCRFTEKEELTQFAETLPNKPYLVFKEYKQNIIS